MRSLLLVVPVLLAGVPGAIVALGEREVDTAFVARQRHPLRVTPDQVERAVMSAPEPVPEPKTRARSARCTPGGAGDIRNPWACTVAYRSGSRFRYSVQIESDGSYRGESRDGTRIIYGCCVAQPSAG
jgi:hypothetical protein